MAGQPRRRARTGEAPAQAPRRYSWPPFEPGNQLARTHGCFAADVDDEAAEIVVELYDPEHVERYPAMALLGAEVWVRRRRALKDIKARGQVLDGDKPHPLLRYLGQWERTLLDLSTRFGLDPKSEHELLRSRADASRAVVDLDSVRARGRAALDARSHGTHQVSEPRTLTETPDGAA